MLSYTIKIHTFEALILQRLAGATLLVFANKQDLPGALSAEEIRKVLLQCILKVQLFSVFVLDSRA